MKRFSFHPKRLVASIGALVAMFGVLVAVISWAPDVVGQLSFVAFGFMLVVALMICPAWIMQPRETPPPRGRGRETKPLGVVRQLRRRDDRPPLDRAARLADLLA